ncbi:MAG: HIT domain-containing protein [Candidatus Aenigmarchaeota archaeon]|nr:HIT domain-containing protein [Candidatus Aenigmarchaeota archaeon]
MEVECIFCAIVKKQVPAKIVYEDEFTLAFLDVRPRSKGMTILVPKQHFENFDENPELSLKVFSSASTISERIKKALQPTAVTISLMPSEVKHFHLRIYPYYKDEVPLIESQPKEMKESELEAVAEKIRQARVEEKPKVEKKEEVKRTEEDILWIKRELELA